MTSFSLLTDRYELTMLQAALEDGTAEKQATFEVFSRGLAPGHRFGVFAGLGRLLPMIEEFTFDKAEVEWLLAENIINWDTAHYLKRYRFSGTVTGFREGELFFPNSPVLTVTGTFAECVVLETLILSVINHDSAIASKAARMFMAAEGRTLIEMGSRRTHEESAVAAARAAYIGGFNITSNLMAGMRHGVPTGGTAAHAWTLAHDTEEEAFASQVKAMGAKTSLLVDTYNIKQGIKNAVAAAKDAEGKGPGAVRIDSGDLSIESEKARLLLDSLGSSHTLIVVSGDMDEYTIKDLKDSPIDSYGVGTKLVSTPPAGFVYKLVEIENEDGTMRPVAKKAKNKVSVGGRKIGVRLADRNGVIAERFVVAGDETPEDYEVLTVVLMKEGARTWEGAASLEDTRAYCLSRIKTLPVTEQKVWSGDHGPYLTAEQY